MQSDLLLHIVVILVPMILSLSVHEYCHAASAYYLGDDTASRNGRFTLNPISHIDPFGTILLPLIGLTSGAIFFGWAKPVPVSPVRFTRKISMRGGMAITAVAGPLSNLLLAILIGFIWRLLLAFDIQLDAVKLLLSVALMMNVGLAIFNMLPVPPLDGSKVLPVLLPARFGRFFEYLESNPMIVFAVFLGIIFFAGRFLFYPVVYLTTLVLYIVGIPFPVFIEALSQMPNVG